MRTAFLLLALLGLLYLIYLILSHYDAKRINNRLRKQFDIQKIVLKFESDQFNQLFKDAGIKKSSTHFNFYRYLGALSYLFISVTTTYFRGDKLDIMTGVVFLLILYVTSPHKFAPCGRILRKIHHQRSMKKDSELISFIRLYENNRMRPNYVKFESFCYQLAPEFLYIKKELLKLSELVIDIGIENALDWFVNQFPRDHPYISKIRTIILTTESLEDHDRAADFLKEQGSIISRISSDQYLRRWSIVGELATVFNSIPSLLTLVMVVILVILYSGIVNSNLSTIN